MTYAANYDPFGKPLEGGGVQASASAQPGYTGAQTDSNGLVYLNARYYDPSLGSFLSLDPAMGSAGNPISFNGYDYTDANPVTYSDPSGKYVGPLFIVCLGIIGGGVAFIADWVHQVQGNLASGMDFGHAIWWLLLNFRDQDSSPWLASRGNPHLITTQDMARPHKAKIEEGSSIPA